MFSYINISKLLVWFGNEGSFIFVYFSFKTEDHNQCFFFSLTVAQANSVRTHYLQVPSLRATTTTNAGVVLLTPCNQRRETTFKKREKKENLRSFGRVWLTRARESTRAESDWSCAGGTVTLAVIVHPPGTILQRKKFVR